jgi:hypothetical protein
MYTLNLSQRSHYDIIITRTKLLIKIVIYKDGNHFLKEEEALKICHELEGFTSTASLSFLCWIVTLGPFIPNDSSRLLQAYQNILKEVNW